MTAQTKSKLDKLISDGEVQHIYGVIGCCKNYYVQFPNDTQKYMYNTNKPISGKLLNKISNYLYTNANMQAVPTGKRVTGKTNPSETNYPATPTGKRLTKKTGDDETKYGKIHHKSVNKIINMLGRTIQMKVTKSTPALKKNTHTIVVKPKYIGKIRMHT